MLRWEKNAVTNNLLSRLGCIDEIPKQDDFSVAREATSGNSSRRLLQGHFLVVAVHGLLRVDMEGTFAVAGGAEVDLDFGIGILEVRTEHLAALDAVKLDILELGEDAGASGDDA